MPGAHRSHGTYRPRLKSLVQQNSAEDVEDATRGAYKNYGSTPLNNTMTTLTKLKGIGPATASLLLAVYTTKAPFFSDELYRWAFFESGDKKGHGWDRPIKYNAKEYLALFERVQQLSDRLQVKTVEAEKVAYVLGKGNLINESGQKGAGAARKRKAAEQPDPDLVPASRPRRSQRKG